MTNIICAACGTNFTIDKNLYNSRKKDRGPFYCPNGHSLTFEENELDRMNKIVHNLKKDLEFWSSLAKERLEDYLEQKKTTTAYKGHLTRLRLKNEILQNKLDSIGALKR